MSDNVQSATQDEQAAQASEGLQQDQVTMSPNGSVEQSTVNSQNDPQIEINGELVSLDELKAGYMRQSDYTQKTQALAEVKRETARSSQPTSSPQEEESLDPEVKQAVETLKKAGMVTKDDLWQLQAQQEDEKKLQQLLSENPSLKAQEKAIRAVGQTDNAAWEDIVVNYGFSAPDKLSIAKGSRSVVGSSVPQEQGQKALKDMSEQEYEAWKQKNVGMGSGLLTKK